ncbi:MAG TPA: GspE/PulE family protein [bacterium]|nr:GspE/PulE family protein [bacterium]
MPDSGRLDGVRDLPRMAADASATATAVDRRDRAVSGRRKREEFDRSLQALRFVGVPDDAMAEAIQILRKTGPRLNRALVQAGLLSARQFAKAIAHRWGLPFSELTESEVDGEAARLVPSGIARRHGVMPIARTVDRVVVAMADPTNVVAIDDIRLLTGLDVRVVVASQDDIARAQNRLGGIVADVARFLTNSASASDLSAIEALAQDEEITVERLRSMTEEAPVVAVINQLIQQAAQMRASDIHLEPGRHELKVRFRIDGMLRDVMTAPKRMQPALVSRVKILASLDISERRLPQDGQIHMRVEGKEYDFRVSTLPTVQGESIVIRVLEQSSADLSLSGVGLSGGIAEQWETLIAKPYGMIVVTGPTGSGKTTTLNASLARINTPERNIVSIEDPVEYQVPGVKQVQVNVRSGLTFANGLRSILRQDPDVVLIGEIRDRETAQIAMQASMTGHLVLTTLHTNDTAGVPIRLTDMGVEPFLITASLVGALAQRLVRVICPRCKETYTAPVEAVRRLGLDPAQSKALHLHRGRGCDYCNGTGYRGRTGVFELLVMNDRLRALIVEQATASQLRLAAQADGMRLMWQDGVEKVLHGVTTVEELLRVVLASESGAEALA